VTTIVGEIVMGGSMTDEDVGPGSRLTAGDRSEQLSGVVVHWRMETVPDPCLLVDELVTGTDEQLQVRVEMGRVHLGQIRLPQGHPSDDDGITLIVFARSPAASAPFGGQARGHIHYAFAGSQELLGECAPVAFGALDRDLPRARQALHPFDELAELLGAGGDRPFSNYPALRINSSSHMHLAVRVDSDRGDNVHDCPSSCTDEVSDRGQSCRSVNTPL
jgi:hypothetical protein